MLRKLTNSFFLNKNLLRQINNKFSSNLESNPNNQQPQKTPDIDPPSVEPPKQSTKQDQSKIRAQTRMRVCRSELNKYVKAELDYEKLKISIKQMQKAQKVLETYGIKIKHIVDQGPLIQFHYAQQIQKKPPKKQQQSNKQKQNNQKPIQEAQKDIKLEYKIYTQPFKQLTSEQADEFDKHFNTLENTQNKPSRQSQRFGKGNNIFGTPKKRSSPISGTSSKQYKNFKKAFRGFHEAQKEEKEQVYDAQYVDRFKEFNLYMRDARKQGSKWVKFELMIEDWKASHFYRISLVDNAEQDAKNLVESSQHSQQYTGLQAKYLDNQLLGFLKLSFQQIQQIDPLLFLSIYYYNGLRENEYYRKWLDDMINLTR